MINIQKNRHILIICLVFSSIIISFVFPEYYSYNGNKNFNYSLITNNIYNTIKYPNASSSSSSYLLYNRESAIGCAYKWYNSRNFHYNEFSTSRGDCANFVSQRLIAGGLSLYKGTDGAGYGVYQGQNRSITQGNGTIPFCDYLNFQFAKIKVKNKIKEINNLYINCFFLLKNKTFLQLNKLS